MGGSDKGCRSGNRANRRAFTFLDVCSNSTSTSRRLFHVLSRKDSQPPDATASCLYRELSRLLPTTNPEPSTTACLWVYSASPFPIFHPRPIYNQCKFFKNNISFPKKPIVRKSPPVNPRIADNYVFSNCWWFRLHGPGPGPFSGMWLNEPVWCCCFFQDNFQCWRS